jgi:pimeloyl-ACP methyl ester carboxylesterase
VGGFERLRQLDAKLGDLDDPPAEKKPRRAVDRALARSSSRHEEDTMKANETTTRLALIAVISCVSTLAAAKPAARHATINGIDYGYEVRGKGEPLLMLHGGLGSYDMFGPALPVLGKGRELILVDLQGHGRTTLGDRPIRCEAIADDVDALLAQLGRAQVDVLGYSFGGCVGMRLAIQHPERVRRLVLVSAPFSNDGFYPDMVAQQKQVGAAMAPMMKETPMYKTYQALAPKADDFPRLLDAMGTFMRQKYDYSADVTKLKMPVMLVFGDADMMRPEHEVKFYQLLGGGLKDAGWNRENMPKNRLAIIPDMTHYEAFASPRTAEAVLPFLRGESAAKSWAEQVKAQPPKK